MSDAIRNCPWGYKCGKQWQELTPTANASVRFCTQCQKEVHRVNTHQQLAEAVVLNRCVAFNLNQLMGEEYSELIITTMGKVINTDRLGNEGNGCDEDENCNHQQ